MIVVSILRDGPRSELVGVVIFVGFPPLDRLLFEIFGNMFFAHLPQDRIGTCCRSPFAHEVIEKIQLLYRETLDLLYVGPELEFHDRFGR